MARPERPLPLLGASRWARPERFDYAPLDEKWAIVRLLAELQDELRSPERVRLTVHRDRLTSTHAAFASLVEQEDELLWRATFAVPVSVIRYRGARFEVAGEGHHALSLPAPLCFLASGPELEELLAGSPFGASFRRRVTALATALAVSTSSTGVLALSASAATPAGKIQVGPMQRAGQIQVGPMLPANSKLAATAAQSAAAKPAPAVGGSHRVASIAPVHRQPPGMEPITLVMATPAHHREAHKHPGKSAPARKHHPAKTRSGTPRPTKPQPTQAQPGKAPSGGSAVVGPTGPSAQKHKHHPRPHHLTLPPHPAPLVRSFPPSDGDDASGSAGTAALGAGAAQSLTGIEDLSALLGLVDHYNGPPLFLIPIYKAAAHRYHVPWQVLAAINWIETDYGRDLSTSSAGAMGWMQFMPGTWLEYAVSATGRGVPNPFSPSDAIFTAAKYLAASGAPKHLRQAIYSYNHATWYVNEVMAQAQAITMMEIGATKPRVRAMMRRAISLLGRPYVYGGGHAGWGPTIGYDCSGFVSAVLHAGGYLVEPVDTTALPQQAGILPGPGKFVTIFDRALPGQSGHVIIEITGQFFESGGELGPWGGGGGVQKIGHPSIQYLATFPSILHPAGL